MSETVAPIQVYVCAVSVADSDPHLAQLSSWLSPAEMARAQRFHQEADRERYTIGRALIRRVCANDVGCDPRDVVLNESSNGKPRLFSNTSLLEFNLSHSGDCVIIAWCAGKAVGVDVEALDRKMTSSFTEMAATAFSDSEREVLQVYKDKHMAETFYRIWVRKEAVLKAEGCGLGGNTKSFSVSSLNQGGVEWLDEVRFPESGRVWKIIDLTTLPNHAAAAAVVPGSIITQCTPHEMGLW